MKIQLAIFLMLGYFSSSFSLPANEVTKSDATDNNQLKRDLTLSYAATDIGSKEGTHVKTITVIKNVAGKKENKPLKIDPKLHKNEDWGSHFRDNFDSYGAIPDVPDIDELFEFVNQKKPKKPEDSPKKETEEKEKKPEEKDKKPEGEDEEPEDVPKKDDEPKTTSAPAPVDETPDESKAEGKVEKIDGDAELIQPGGAGGKVKVKSQSLDMAKGKYSVQETMFDVNYSTPQHTVRQYFSNEKYILAPATPYNYPDPSITKGFQPSNSYSPQGSVIVTTPSGKKFDVPVDNVTDKPPYLAPNFRRNQNSVAIPPFVSSSQRPYVAPNLRKPYEFEPINSNSAVNSNCAPNISANNQQPANNVFRSIPTNIRINSFGGFKPPNIPRSRGLRYR